VHNFELKIKVFRCLEAIKVESKDRYVFFLDDFDWQRVQYLVNKRFFCLKNEVWFFRNWLKLQKTALFLGQKSHFQKFVIFFRKIMKLMEQKSGFLYLNGSFVGG